MTDAISISRSAAPEDIRPGCYVAVHSVVKEFLPMGSLLDRWQSAPPKPLRISFVPCDCGYCGNSAPMKVKAVCLPFVFVKTPRGDLRSIDVRRNRLTILSQDYGEKVFKKLKDKARPKRTNPTVNDVNR